MRTIRTTVALVAAAAIISSMSAPALAKSRPKPNESFNSFFQNFFGSGGGWHSGGGWGGGFGHGSKSYVDIPGTPGTPGSKATETIVYFGTCNNLAGIQQAGNADADGFCLPFESLVGSEASAGTPGSGPSCAVTTTSRQPPSYGRMSSGGSGGGETTTQIVSGTCDTVKAAEQPKWPPHGGPTPQ